MRFFKLIFLPILLFLRCSQNVENKTDFHTANLIKTDEILKIGIDESTKNVSSCTQSFKGESTWKLSYLNQSKNEILIFDINEGTLERTIVMAYEGPQGIGEVTGFTFASPDSLLVVVRRKKGVYLVNGYGEPIEFFDFGIEGPFPFVSSKISNRIDYNNGKVYVTAQLEGNWNAISSSELAETSFCYAYDLHEQKGQFLDMSYPKGYWKEGRIEPVLSRVYLKGDMYFGMFGSHEMYAYSLSSKEIVNKSTYSSKYFEKFEYPGLNPTMDTYLKYLYGTHKYLSIIHDPYRKVFYRISVPSPREGQQAVDYQRKLDFPDLASVIIYDEKLNVLGETLLDKYLAYDNYFVTEKGLYISENHPENPNNDEDYLSYKLFQLERAD